MNSNLLHEADYYEILDEEDQVVQCNLCPHECILNPKEKGICKARMNISGKLYSLTYGYATMGIDKIEKQYVYHFFPGARVQTFETYNCNLDCKHCLVSDKSQIDPEQMSGKKYPPEQAAMFGMASGSRVICFGDSEPLISFEWVRDTAKVAKEKGLKILLRTNAYFKEEPIKEILEYLDGIAVEIKAVNDEDYEENCNGGSFSHISKIMKLIHNAGKHLEVSLVIHENLKNDEIASAALANFIATELSPDIPLHLLRMMPAYRMKEANPTSRELLEESLELAKETGLNYVYIGGIPDHESSDTKCPNCGQELITRNSISTTVERVSLAGKCNKCQDDIYIVMR